MVEIVIVNACKILPDKEVAAWLPAIQSFDDQVLMPAWGLDKATYHFQPYAQRNHIPALPAQPIYLNKHSTDADALGFHDKLGARIFSRVFVGDCKKYGVNPLVDLTHEAWEMRIDPTIDLVVRLPNGDIAAVEGSDAVEDDKFAIPWMGHSLSDVVLPSYFFLDSGRGKGPWDYGKHLTGACPHLTSGGYQSLQLKGHGPWTQVSARLLSGEFSWRAVRQGRGHRRATGSVPQ